MADAKAVFERIYKDSVPGVVSGVDSNIQIFYSSHFITYIERDVRQLSEVVDSLQFFRFITATAARCGQMLNLDDIAVDTDINLGTGKELVGDFGGTGIFFFMPIQITF